MNETIQGKGFWISYNPSTDQGEETALCQNKISPRFLILLGDYTAEFKPLVEQGYDACFAKFKELVTAGAEMSLWSEGYEEEILEADEDLNEDTVAYQEEREVEYAEMEAYPSEGN